MVLYLWQVVLLLLFVALGGGTTTTSSPSAGTVASSKWTLKGKNVVVTGGTKGIGKAVCDDLLALGANVLTCGRNEAEVLACLESWKSEGFGADRVSAVVADVSTTDGRCALQKKCTDVFGRSLDCLINNVGTNRRKKSIEYSEEDYDFIMRTNLQSAFWLTNAFHSQLKETSGSVVIIGSVAGGCGVAIRSGVLYAMTKAALNQLIYNLASEWGKEGIRINGVSPWYTRTPLADQVLSQPEFYKEVCDRTPLGRVASADEVASVVSFLCMPAASYVTGQVLAVDGGFLRSAFY